MASSLQRLLNRHFLWIQKKTEVARYEGIILADVRRRSPHFQTTLLAALRFIRDCDARRFARVQRHIAWVVNCGLELGNAADYNSETRTCTIDFEEPEREDDREWYFARYARTLIHEATHGALICRRIAYTPELRPRVEGICVTEQNRFLDRAARLRPDLADLLACLKHDFDPSAWDTTWTASRWRRALSALQHLRST